MKRTVGLGFVTMGFVALAFSALLLSLAVRAHSQEDVPPSGLGITRLVIDQRKVAFGGQSFGSAGQYELLTGTAYGELEPKAAGNAVIVNLDRAPRNARGQVEYSTDVVILKPVDMAKGGGTLLYDVVNRGSKLALARFDGGSLNLSASDAGNGFLMTHGYTVVWSGWQGDLREASTAGGDKAVIGHFPVANRDGKPIVGPSREEFTDVPEGPTFTVRLDYPAAALDQSSDTLTVREHEADPHQPIPSTNWRYVDVSHIQITPPAGFDRGALYEFVYRATNPVVMGIGFAATRDLISFLRYADRDSTGQPNPVRPQGTAFKATLSEGVSQSGRFLKDFLYQGFNADIAGRAVFDGIMPIVSGARRTFTNYQFAQPGRFSRQHEDHLYPGDQFPFTYATTTDALTGKTDGLLTNCTKSRTCPLIIEADSEAEIWQARVSLVVTDTNGHAISLPDNVRAFMFMGAPHATASGPLSGAVCQQYQNPMSWNPYARALLVALERWVKEGAAPPTSQFPSLKNHTLVPLAQAQAAFPHIPGAPYSPVINSLRVVSATVPPVSNGFQYPVFVTLPNADGNSTGGIETLEVAAPVATYEGRNTRAAGFSEGELCGNSGSYIPFAPTRQERTASGDSRPSLEERYPTLQDLVAKRKRAIDALVQQRLLLPEDAAAMAGTLSSEGNKP